jgi:7,8-dihydro-6-hydroxymethylpterin-pyrophosphokinase
LRTFVLQPLLEIAPDCIIPAMGPAQQALKAFHGPVLEKMADGAQ